MVICEMLALNSQPIFDNTVRSQVSTTQNLQLLSQHGFFSVHFWCCGKNQHCQGAVKTRQNSLAQPETFDWHQT